MPSTPNLNLPYPAPAASPDVPYDLQQLAQTIETSIQFGVKTVPVSSATWASVSVTFATPFASPPVVVATTSVAGTPLIAAVYNITATGFTLAVGNRDNTAFSATPNAQWIAIGPST